MAATKKEAQTEALCACLGIRSASRAFSQLYDDALRPVGIRSGQFTLLRIIDALQPVTVGLVADKLQADQTTISRNLRPLIRDGLINIKRGQDGRERELWLTPQGQRTFEQAYPLWEKIQHRVAEVIGAGRLHRVLNELRTVVSKVNEMKGEG